jgi:hypothetical protein
MKHQIAMFKFTLGNGQSIGPAALQQLWERCCGTNNVSVGRHAESFGGNRVTYSLYASQHLPDLEKVEKRLRHMLDDGKFAASLIPLHRA